MRTSGKKEIVQYFKGMEKERNKERKEGMFGW
jgi:hypothetical protein